MFEMIQTGFSTQILQHVRALNFLIELMYKDPSMDRMLTDLIVEDFGMLEMMFCLKYEIPSLLRDTRRKLGLRQEDRDTKGEEKGKIARLTYLKCRKLNFH